MTAPFATGPDPRKAKLYDQLRSKGLSHKDAVAQIEGNGGGPGLGQQFMRGAGLIGRMGLQGVGNLASLPFGIAGAAYQGVTGNQPPALLQGNQGTAAANQMGLPQPQGAGERILTSAGENAVMSGVLPGAGAGLAALGGAAGAAGQAATEGGAGPMGQMAASAAVGMGVPVVATMGAAAIRAAIAGSTARREAARQSTALLQAGNPQAPMTLGQVAEGGIARTVEGGLRNVPGASATFQRVLKEQGDAMSARATKLADQISRAGTPTTAGAAVQRGISEGFVPKFRAQSKQLYEKVYALMSPETPVIPGKTVGLFAEQSHLAAQARPLSDGIASPQMTRWADEFAQTLEAHPQGIPFNLLKEFRSKLGASLDGSDTMVDVTRRDLKRLYNTLTDDLGGAVAETAGEQGARLWNRATTFTRVGHDRLDNILQPLLDKKIPERAFTALFSGTKEGATVLRSTMRSLKGDEKRLVASTVLRRLGKANPGAQDDVGSVFSPDTYLKRWNDLSSEAKGALFEGIDPMVTKDLNALAKAASLQKSAANVLPNRSGTASNTAFWSIFQGLGQSATIAGGALAGNQVAGGTGAAAGAIMGPMVAAGAAKLLAEKVFTNPRMIRWLVKQTRVPLGAIQQELLILTKDSQKWDAESRDLADELNQLFSTVDWKTVGLATAVADATR